MMNENFMNSKLPEIVIKNEREKFFDPIRKKFISVKPEEVVRQHLIPYLIDELEVPKNFICVEEPLAHYQIDSKERADIIVDYEEENAQYPLLIIECKAPEIFLNDKAREQMFSYAGKLGNKYCWLTNGEENYFYCLDENGYIEIDEIPNYFEMLEGKYNPAPIEEFESRLELEELKENYQSYVNAENIGKHTPENLAIPMTNFLECLRDTEHEFPAKKYKIFSVIKDCGLRYLTVGNSSGGSWSNNYRSFWVNYDGEEKFVSFAVYDDGCTRICIAIEKDEKPPHHSLQLNVDKHFAVYDKKVRFLHDGRITCGSKGPSKIEDFKKFVSEKYPKIYPRITYGEKFYFGTLTNNKLWYLDDEEVMQVIENLISYALIRDDYREFF